MYRVLVDDNFDYMDEDDRWELGAIATAEEAIAACRAPVDRNLAEQVRPGMTAAELYDRYVSFCDDPFVVAPAGAPKVDFSAWNYAKERAEETCKATHTG